MNFNPSFFIQSILMGAGLAMDAFSASLTDGLSEPGMKKRKMLAVAGIFALFQAAMPLIGWFLAHTLLGCFRAIEPYIPCVALALLAFIGGKMLIEGIKCKGDQCTLNHLGVGILLLQGVATSIDALSVGPSIAHYSLTSAAVCVSLIAAVTFVICYAGIVIGKRFGTALAGRAQMLGGIMLIAIGIWIFLMGTWLK